MSDHEPPDIADEDKVSGQRDEPRAARKEARMPSADRTPGHKGREPGVTTSGNDDAQVASEPMDLQRLSDDDCHPAPPGRQRTGDPPAH